GDFARWVNPNGGFTFVSKPGVKSSDAIEGFVRSRFRGECLGCLQTIVLWSAKQSLGAARFDALHPSGLTVGSGDSKSTAPHVRAAARIDARDMVPGDWVYMKNKDDYNKDLRPGVRPGYWQ